MKLLPLLILGSATVSLGGCLNPPRPVATLSTSEVAPASPARAVRIPTTLASTAPSTASTMILGVQ